jgi:hypothetical protein
MAAELKRRLADDAGGGVLWLGVAGGLYRLVQLIILIFIEDNIEKDIGASISIKVVSIALGHELNKVPTQLYL